MSSGVSPALFEDIKQIYRSKPIAEIRNGSISLSNSRSSSSQNLTIDSSHSTASTTEETRLEFLPQMGDTNGNAMMGKHGGDSGGSYSIGGSSEKLSSPGESSSEHNTKTKFHDLTVFRTTLQDQQNYKKARKVKFFRNGDKIFTGMFVAISSDKFKTMPVLMQELTRLLSTPACLKEGVRAIYDVEGNPILDLESFVDNDCYVAASKEPFQYLDYEALSTTNWNLPTQNSKGQKEKLSSILNDQCNVIEENRDFIKPKTITICQNGNPRTTARLLLNKKTAFSFEQVIRDINDAIKLNCGAVRKVFTINGKQVTKLSEFFKEDDIFVACGAEKLKTITDEDLCVINEKVSLGSKSPIMARRKSVGSKSPLLGRRSPGSKSPSRGSLDYGNDFSPLKILDSVTHQEF